MVKSCSTRAALVVIIICLFALPVAASVSYVSSTPQIITKGDPFTLMGTGAENGTVAIWIIGRSYIDSQIIIPEKKGNFSFSLSGRDTQKLPTGQYAFVIQDPGPDGLLDIEFRESAAGNITLLSRGKTFADIGTRDNIRSSIVPTLIDLSSSGEANTDDVFTAGYFYVEDPMVFFDQVTTPSENRLLGQLTGSSIVFTGTTNLAVNDLLSASINDAGSDALVTSKRIPVTQGTDLNIWSYTLESPGLQPGNYYLTIGPADPPATGTRSAVFSVTKTLLPTPTQTVEGGTVKTPQWFDPTLPLFIVVGMLIVLGVIAFAMWRR